jgi:hypothetical protein
LLDFAHMAYAAGVLVVHGPYSGQIAIRLAMDLRSDGIDARPIALETITENDWQQRLPGVTGLVIIYDGRTWIVEEVEAALRDIDPARPVVFARSGGNKLSPSFDLRFHSVALFDAPSFSYYQPRKGRGGRADVVGYLGGPFPVKDARKRGFAFLSYSSQDRTFIDATLVPTLASCDIGFFDYRFTDQLDERKLAHEIERRVKRCALIVEHISKNWPNSEYTVFEHRLAKQHRKPIIAATDRATPINEDAAIVCVLTEDLEANSRTLMQAIGIALQGTRYARLLRATDLLRS